MVWLDVYSEKVIFSQDSSGQGYSSQVVPVEVSANYQTWELVVILTDASGPESTIIPADAFQVAVLPGTIGGGTPVPHPALIAEGEDLETGIYTPYALTFFCSTMADLPAGLYTGEVRFLVRRLDEPNQGLEQVAWVPYCLEKKASDPTCVLEVLSDSVKESIGPYPDTYPIQEPVSLELTASQVGWALTLSCTDLTPSDSSIHDLIRANEIYLVGANGSNQPLDTIQALILSGPQGITPLVLELCAITTAQHKLGTYVGNLVVSCQASPTQPAREVLVPIELKVQVTSLLTLVDPLVYFHFGRPGSSQTAQIQGSLRANSPMSITLSSSTGSPQQMPQVKPFGTAEASDVPIPTEWKLGEAGTAARLPDTVSASGNALTWSVQGLPGEVPLQFELTVSPGQFQAPGDYNMQVRVDLTPLL